MKSSKKHYIFNNSEALCRLSLSLLQSQLAAMEREDWKDCVSRLNNGGNKIPFSESAVKRGARGLKVFHCHELPLYCWSNAVDLLVVGEEEERKANDESRSGNNQMQHNVKWVRWQARPQHREGIEKEVLKRNKLFNENGERKSEKKVFSIMA